MRTKEMETEKVCSEDEAALGSIEVRRPRSEGPGRSPSRGPREVRSGTFEGPRRSPSKGPRELRPGAPSTPSREPSRESRNRSRGSPRGPREPSKGPGNRPRNEVYTCQRFLIEDPDNREDGITT